METTDFPIMTETKLERIAWLSARDHQKEFNNLMHLYNSMIKFFSDGKMADQYYIEGFGKAGT